MLNPNWQEAVRIVSVYAEPKVLAEQSIQVQKASAIFKYPQVERKNGRPGKKKKTKESHQEYRKRTPQGGWGLIVRIQQASSRMTIISWVNYCQ